MPHRDPAARKEYALAYRERTRELAKAWRLANPGRNVANVKAWRSADPNRAKESARRSYKKRDKQKVRETARRWRAATDYANSPKRKAQNFKDWLRTYGLTGAQYDEMVQTQGGRCAICGSSTSGRKGSARLLIDHCHQTGKIRGLLCFFCNTMLGNAKDSPDRLRVAAEYLEMRR